MRILFTATTAGLILAAASASAQTFAFTTLDNPGDPTFNQLLGINDSGTIVGYFGSGAAGHPNIGYEIASPYKTYTSNMQPGSVQTQATGINNAGVTTGFWSDTNLGVGMDANFAFVREAIKTNFEYISTIDPLALSPAPRTSQALGVNNNSIVAGFFTDAHANPYGFTYSLLTATYTKIKINGATSTTVTGINDSSETSGFYTTKNATVGFVRNATGSVVTSFTVPGSTSTQLLGINNAGVAVGTFVDSNQVSHGLYYTPSTGAWSQVDDPNGLGGGAGSGTVVNGINNKGKLVGFYTDSAGNTHGMIVTVTQ
jgi:hypothetical protein